jgi:hypothetical protein
MMMMMTIIVIIIIICLICLLSASIWLNFPDMDFVSLGMDIVHMCTRVPKLLCETSERVGA